MKNHHTKILWISLVGITLGSGFARPDERADLQAIIRANVASLSEFKPVNLYQKGDRLRFGCDMFDSSASQVSIHAIWRKEGQEFQKGQRAQWNNNVLSSGFSLGNTMSLDSDTVDVIGTRCEVSFSCILRASKENLEIKECLKFTESNSPRVFALMQYQAVKELNIDNSYTAFDPTKQNAVLEYEDDNSRFSVILGKSILKACLGSRDVFLGEKKIVMKYAILMDENGGVQVTPEFYQIISLLK